MKKYTALLLALMILGAIEMAEAKRFDKGRVQQGIQSGELTKVEAAKIRAQQAYQNKMRKQYMSDGILNPWEKSELRKMESRQDANIYHQKHDSQDRN